MDYLGQAERGRETTTGETSLGRFKSVVECLAVVVPVLVQDRQYSPVRLKNLVSRLGSSQDDFSTGKN